MFIFILIALLVILLVALKIALLSAIYTLLILILMFLFIKISKREVLFMYKFKPVFWTFCLLLVVFCFSYYGDHGWWDEAYLPLGHGKRLANSEHMTYFSPESTNYIVNVDSFLVRNDHLCFASDNEFYDYRLDAGKLIKYNSQRHYDKYASVNYLPPAKEFKQFQPQYDAYWNGWRLWLLP
ncbi:MAG TPA: hypothetical protein VK671_09910 [Mucilaginibacter sp.]|jgi:energy-coupling factor transporter transmembrane protein EcfT|nr:hypothetical protein [Mucilaginibacter sp.]